MFKFKMNSHEWEILEVNADDLLDVYKRTEPEAYYCFGLTVFNEQKIYINKSSHKDKKVKTLYHELLHTYIYEFCSRDIEFDNEEIICDISANSHDMIHKIVVDYFNN